MAKTSLKIRAKAWDVFNRECKAASLRRDDFLNRALPGEIDILKKITPCDWEGERWLKRNWIDRGDSDDTELRAIPILLSGDVLDTMNNVCEEKKVPRDAFFDCALRYFVQRLYEAVVVIKSPRTGLDLVAQIAEQINDTREEVTEKDTEVFVVGTVNKWAKTRRLEYFSDDYYQQNLSIDASKVREHNFLLELASAMPNNDLTANRKVRIKHLRGQA
ncbi:MAG: hypothetical protein IPI20_14030 [Rhodoferax sp.]|jgi:hypothetical protein|nr:hypothetical protein [Rhodoferax sp.]MBK7548859.1 hypothetical protein [Rhodoferax sp.]